LNLGTLLVAKLVSKLLAENLTLVSALAAWSWVTESEVWLAEAWVDLLAPLWDEMLATSLVAWLAEVSVALLAEVSAD
jgi:hypothetical protein